MRGVLCGFVVGCAIASAAPTAALAQTQEQRAAELDRRGRDAFARGDFETAALRFDEADRLAPYVELRYNAALAWERAQQPALAADAYERALGRGGLDDVRTERARQSLAALKERLAYVRVPAPVGGVLSVAHLKRAPIPARFHLPPGEHSIVIERPDGTRATRRVSARAGEVQVVELEPEPLGVAPPPPAEIEPAPVEPREPASSATTWGFVALGGAVLLGASAAYLGVQTQKARDDFEESDHTNADDRERGIRYRALTNVALGGAVICAGLGVYLLVSGSGEPGRPTIALGVRGPRLDASVTF